MAVAGSVKVRLTTQAPQPPSRHMNFVPLSRATSLMYCNKLVPAERPVTENMKACFILVNAF